ncbi:MAG: 4Fe-4S binding protein [Archaeoglobaceae archaeon]|nr:4Fe-4S binding protein [Archaeoglobaceae archaeon]MCX8152041.1 4Fe-4S binding protein [Archaeoglobaceae archaeon]MDW8013598.1 4Fe-4S dicluster-binding protein [Archaeoglobaceae archaeon]
MKLKIYFGASSPPLQSLNLKTGDWGTHFAVVDKEKCTGCKVCEQYCPEDCIEVKESGKEKYAVVNYYYCKGCGVCASVCNFGAIKMELKEFFR